jgi:hypothetical protein
MPTGGSAGAHAAALKYNSTTAPRPKCPRPKQQPVVGRSRLSPPLPSNYATVHRYPDASSRRAFTPPCRRRMKTHPVSTGEF